MKIKPKKDISELEIGEPHPAASLALSYVSSLGMKVLTRYLESFSSCAIEGNRLGEVCAETLRRLLHDEPVSDRYLLGLACTIHYMEDTKNRKT